MARTETAQWQVREDWQGMSALAQALERTGGTTVALDESALTMEFGSPFKWALLGSLGSGLRNLPTRLTVEHARYEVKASCELRLYFWQIKWGLGGRLERRSAQLFEVVDGRAR